MGLVTLTVVMTLPSLIASVPVPAPVVTTSVPRVADVTVCEIFVTFATPLIAKTVPPVQLVPWPVNANVKFAV
jgi:hypothetical protein